MEFFRSVSEWFNSLSAADQEYIGSICRSKKMMLCEIIAGTKLYNKYVLDWSIDDLRRAQKDLRGGILSYVVSYVVR